MTSWHGYTFHITVSFLRGIGVFFSQTAGKEERSCESCWNLDKAVEKRRVASALRRPYAPVT